MENQINLRKSTSITATNALIRSTSAPSCALIAPSGSGKTTLTNAIINASIAKAIAIGVGEKNQTTLISTEFILDSRISDEQQFSLKVVTKPFDTKRVLIVLREQLFKLFCANAFIAEDTISCMDEPWFQNVLEPIDASYHLAALTQQLNLETLQNAVLPLLNNIDQTEGKSFTQVVNERKKDLPFQGKKISELRADVFEELWEKQSDESKEPLNTWLMRLDDLLHQQLTDLISTQSEADNTVLVIDNAILDEVNSEILSELYNPYSPLSLIIREIKIACRPREELVELYRDDYPFRFCLRDTMGLTQSGIDDDSISSALEIGMNYKADSLIVLFSLEERSDVLKSSCNLIAEKLSKTGKLGIPVHILFTKADKLIETKVDRNKGSLVLTQEDYNNHVINAIEEIEREIKNISEKIPSCKSMWISMRYREQDMDPVQQSLSQGNLWQVRFQPKGLYQFINEIVQEVQTHLLPKGIINPIFVTTKDPNQPPISIRVDASKLESYLSNIQVSLTKDKSNVNGYMITTELPLHGRSVSTYWDRLQDGLGHTTRAKVYGNFSINMKGLLNKVLRDNISDINTFYLNNAIATSVDNLSIDEIETLLKLFDATSLKEQEAFDGWNPDVLEKLDMKCRYAQQLHFMLRKYFDNTSRYYLLLDRVAFQLSFGNIQIQRLLIKTYNEYSNYDRSMRSLQAMFNKIFGCEEFKQIIVDELGKTMTNMLNKLFIAI